MDFGATEYKTIDHDNNRRQFDIGEHKAKIEDVTMSANQKYGGDTIDVLVGNDDNSQHVFYNFTPEPGSNKPSKGALYNRNRIVTLLTEFGIGDKELAKSVSSTKEMFVALKKLVGKELVAHIQEPYGDSKYNQIELIAGREPNPLAGATKVDAQDSSDLSEIPF